MGTQVQHEEYLFAQDDTDVSGPRLCLACGSGGHTWVAYRCREGVRHLLFCEEHSAPVVQAGPTLCETCSTFAEIVGTRLLVSEDAQRRA